MEKVRISWCDDEEELMLSIPDGEWIITTDNQLTYLTLDDDKSDFNVKESFSIFGLAPHHTTDWLRFFCSKHHPEIDFDKEFETDKPGVFARYQEKFRRDYEGWVEKKKLKMLKEELAIRGYQLSWEKEGES